MADYSLDTALRKLTQRLRDLEITVARQRLGTGANTTYDPSASPPLAGTDVQTAIDELQAEIDALPAPGIAGITVDDEGTPLATLATTLDFVGAGVTASGTGATKTITIPGGAGGDTSGQIVLGWDAGNFLLVENTMSIPIEAPFTCTITSWDCFGNPGVAGSCSIDVWKKATYPPAVGDSIVNVGSGGVKPGLTASDNAIGGSITHFTTAITAGDIFLARLDSVSLFGMVELVIRYSRP